MVIKKHPIHEEHLSYQHTLRQGRVLFVGAVTDTGPKRTGNEDSILAEAGLFVVADGMGGHEAGEIASELAVTHIKTHKDSSQSLAQIVEVANTTIFDHGQTYPQHQGLGTTVVALRFNYDGTAQYAHVGDSRLYQLNIYDSAKGFRQVTKDHSLVQQMVDRGRITEEQALNHPQSNVILRSLGSESSVTVDNDKITSQLGDVFVLCSDGFSNAAQNPVIGKKIFELYELGKDEAEIAAALRDFAAKEYGADNISVIVVRAGTPFPENFVSSPLELQKHYAPKSLEARIMKQYELAANAHASQKTDAKKRYTDLLESSLTTSDPFIRQIMVPYFAAQYLGLVRATLRTKEGAAALKDDLSPFYERLGFKEHFGTKTEDLVAALFNDVYSIALAADRENAMQYLDALASFPTKESIFYAGAIHFLKQKQSNGTKTKIPTARDLYAVAEDSYQRKKWVTSTNYLEAVLALDDHYADAHELLAHVHLERPRKNAARAQEHLKKAAHLIEEGAGVRDPIFVYRTLGSLYLDTQQLPEAVATFAKLGADYLQKSKDLLSKVYDTARSCRKEADQKQKQDNASAQLLYNAALIGFEALPAFYNEPRVCYNKGKCYEGLGKLETALKSYQNGIAAVGSKSDASWDLQQACARVQRKIGEKK